jgi:broad specificity phosphatase PhoE
MKIYFVRHTEADDDRRDSFGGIANDPLIESGKNYAKLVGNVLAEKNIEVIYTSPYARAKETAKLMNESVNAVIVEVYNLRERNSYGVLSGIEKDRAKTLFPQIAARVKKMKQEGAKPSKSLETLPGAEVYLDLLLRAEDAFRQIFRESELRGVKEVAVVTHGGFSWAFFRDVIKIPMDLEKGQIVILEGDDLISLVINGAETKKLEEKVEEAQKGNS